ncbi:hypothetical protein SBA4_5970004 [Candidatus Sulfopaludibacter sp. SbA4]|nr:hypothetical protein SBA4_5970004 [Candidatus Sulfopaludibacter sp. SbA4]
MGHQSSVQTPGHSYTELPARPGRRTGLRYGITVLPATQQVGTHRIAAIHDSLFGRVTVRMASRKVWVFNQEPTAIFSRERANREWILVDIGEITHDRDPPTC